LGCGCGGSFRSGTAVVARRAATRGAAPQVTPQSQHAPQNAPQHVVQAQNLRRAERRQV